MTSVLADLLSRTEALADRAGLTDVATGLQALGERLDEQRVYVAVLGQFKRGKSTLINALLGEEVLPSSIVPLTAVPTVLKHGDVRAAEVRFLDDRPAERRAAATAEELLGHVASFVTEKANPENVLNVAQVDVLHPSDVLGGGLVLVDTPGIGSTLEHNTQATINFLPQCDAAIFVLSPDPPLTQVEQEFLSQVTGRVSRLYYVLTKSDYVGDEDLAELLAYLADLLEAATDERPEIIAVSGRRALEAAEQESEALRLQSGVGDLEAALGAFVQHEMESVLHASVLKRLAETLAEIAGRLALERRLLTMPLSDLEERAAQFRSELEVVAAERRAAHDLIAGDKRRLGEELEEQSAALRSAATDHLTALVAQHRDQPFEAVLANEIPPYFERALGEFSGRMSDRVESTLRAHQDRADAIIARLRTVASDLFAIEYAAPASSEAYQAKREPYWVTHEWQVSPRAIEPESWERLLPRSLKEKRENRRLREVIDRLVINNVENIRWAILQNLNDGVFRFAGSLDRRLAQTAEDIERAIGEAATRQRDGSAQVAPRLALLDELEAEVERLSEGVKTAIGVSSASRARAGPS